MRQELKLLKLYEVRKLHNYFLWEVAELLRLPAPRARAWVEQFSDRVVLVFATTVNDPVFELTDALAIVRGLLRIHHG